MKKLILIVALLLIACSNPFDSSITVKYEVTGSAELVNVTYQNNNGGISQITDVVLPWSMTFSGNPEDYVYLSAQNQGETGSITVTIYKDNDIFKSATSSGSYVVASVSGTI